MKKNTDFIFFLPTRKGSERIQQKNTRPFLNFKGGLLELKLKQLLEIPEVPICLSTNDPKSMEIAEAFGNDRIRIIERPAELCLSSTNLEDLIAYIPSILKEKHILWTHATSPFVTKENYEEAMDLYKKSLLEGRHDSLLSVNRVQTFLWDPAQNNFISHNRQQTKWPRTQDLRPLFEVNSAIFINSRENYIQQKDRIGKNPVLYELDQFQSFDIDWKDDFNMAEMIYQMRYKG